MRVRDRLVRENCEAEQTSTVVLSPPKPETYCCRLKIWPLILFGIDLIKTHERKIGDVGGCSEQPCNFPLGNLVRNLESNYVNRAKTENPTTKIDTTKTSALFSSSPTDDSFVQWKNHLPIARTSS
ncbi:unnamed protein product [Linum trigynum]|uniref:Uncharacterized protein n=1 Tax=Linum trigynum TaxID=586398 RepID=A0AAV2D6V3_9ROSI